MSLILLTPLAVGSVEPWAFVSMEVTIFLLVAVWLVKHLLLEANVVESDRGIYNLALPAVLLVALIAFQMVRLPPSIEAMVSPSTFELYQKSLPGWPDKPGHNESAAASPHSEGLVLLPTSGDVAAGAPVPFVNIASQSSFFAPREPDVENRRGPRWRPLSIDTSLTGPALLKLVGYLCLFLLLVSFPSGEKGESSFARKLLCTALLAGVLVAAVALAERISPNGRALWVFVPYDWPKGSPWGSRATGPFANPDHLASYLDLVLPIALSAFLMPAAFVSRRRAEARLFFATALIVIAAALLLTSSRGGWVGALFGTAMLAGLWRIIPRNNCAPRGAGIAAWTLLSAFVLLVLLVIGPAGRVQTDARLEETVAQNSIVSRLRPSKLSLKIIQDFPVFGLGLGCWPEVFPRYLEPPWSFTFWNAAHNDYIQFASETGLLGCGLLVWFFAATLSRVRYTIRRIRPEAALLVAGCLGGISAVGMHEFFDFPLQIPANALLFTILLGIAVRMTQSTPSQPVDPDIRHRRLLCCIGLVSALALIAVAITQRRTPYPYNLRQPATLAQAYSLENAHPANARVHLMLARMLTNGMSAKYRMEELRAALWLEPTNPLARDLYAQALLQANNKKEALTEISRSVSYSPTLDSHFYLEPRMIPWLSFSARRAVELGFRTAVADHYEGAVQNFASYYGELAEFSAQGALYSATAVQKQDRESRAEYFVDAGVAYAKAGELKKAEASFRAAFAAAPEHSSAYEQLVLLVFVPQNNLAAAKAIVAQGIETGADPFQLYLALGLAAQTSGNSSEAEAALLKASAIRPSSLEPLIRMGELNLATNKFDQAATWLKKATSLDPSSAEAFYDLGLADEGAYEYFAADQAYQQALALAPTDERFNARYAAFRQKIIQSKSNTLKP